jgi:hypothetical protein
VKDNVANKMFIVDKRDCSLVRNVEYYRRVFEQADLDILYEDTFNSMPKDFYEVRIFAMR